MIDTIRETLGKWACVLDWHTWTDGETLRAIDGGGETGPVVVKRHCRWCGIEFGLRWATQREALRFAEEESMRRAEFDRQMSHNAERYLPTVEDITGILCHPVVVGESRAAMLPLATREQVEKLRNTWRPDEVAAQVMEAGIGREEPLVPRRWTSDSRVPRRADVAEGLTCARAEE